MKSRTGVRTLIVILASKRVRRFHVKTAVTQPSARNANEYKLTISNRICRTGSRDNGFSKRSQRSVKLHLQHRLVRSAVSTTLPRNSGRSSNLSFWIANSPDILSATLRGLSAAWSTTKLVVDSAGHSTNRSNWSNSNFLKPDLLTTLNHLLTSSNRQIGSSRFSLRRRGGMFIRHLTSPLTT